MKPETEATLNKLDSVEWFRCVGKTDVEQATLVSSWTEAIKHVRSAHSKEVVLEAANRITEGILKSSLDRYANYNAVVATVKPPVVEMVKRKSASTAEQHALPKEFIDRLNWNILHLAIECEFADVIPAGFFTALSYYYYVGHFPCGWEGEYPKGRLIVY